MPYRMPVVSEKFQRVRGRSQSAWHGGGAGQKRRIRAVRDRAVRTAPAARRSLSAQHFGGSTWRERRHGARAGNIARCSRRRTFLCKQLSETTLTCIPTASRANLRLQLLCPSPGAIGF